MIPPDDLPLHSKCLPCRKGRCVGCLWESRPTSCGCACPWLIADVLAHFPSLRRLRLVRTEGDE